MKILLIEDEDKTGNKIAKDLRELGHSVEWKATASSALTAFEQAAGAFDVSIIDLGLPFALESDEPSIKHGLTLIERIRESGHNTHVIVLTQESSREAFECARGALPDSFLIKPLSADQLKVHLWNAQRYISTQQTYAEDLLRRDLPGGSEAMIQLRKEVLLYAPTEIPILIRGERGSGKSMVARAIHRHSKRSTLQMFSCDMTALPVTLAESLLFGCRKGVHSAARRDTKGRFEAARNSTLFLDEIGDLHPQTQPKILKAIEDREIFVLGDNVATRIDVRFISATNRRLTGKKFRPELRDRLSGKTLIVPPLREYVQDLPEVIDRLQQQISNKVGYWKPLAKDAVKKLQAHTWPGNIRELELTLVRTLIESGDAVIRPKDIVFDASVTQTSTAIPPGSFTVEAAQKHLPCRVDDLIDSYSRTWYTAALRKSGVFFRISTDKKLKELLDKGNIEGARSLVQSRPAGAAGLLGLAGKTFEGRVKKFGMLAKEPATW